MYKRTEKLSSKVNDFHPTEDGEASEKSEGASNKPKLSLDSHLDIPINLLGRCVFLYFYIIVFFVYFSFCPSSAFKAVNNSHLDVPINLVIGRRVKVDLEEVQLSLFPG